METEQKALETYVDNLYAENDKKAFEIMHRIAALALEQAQAE